MRAIKSESARLRRLTFRWVLGLSGVTMHCSLEEHPTDRCSIDDDCLGRRFCVDGVCRDELPASAGESGAGGDGGAAGSRFSTSGASGSAGGAGAEQSAAGSDGDGQAGAGTAECRNQVELPQGFCIDGEEVTRRAYDAWLQHEPSPLLVPGCEENRSLEPGCEWPGFETGEDWAERTPATCIDWCDAYTFCAAFDMHLCGAIGGGPSEFSHADDPSKNEWSAACSAGGDRLYPYGQEFVGGFCVDATAGELRRGGSKAACRGTAFPYSCVVDLSGNAAEWVNACESDEPDAQCLVRGGSYLDTEAGVSCSSSATRNRMDTSDPSVGFRCCKNDCEL